VHNQIHSFLEIIVLPKLILVISFVPVQNHFVFFNNIAMF